jgi:YihY family inner membrane protein
MLPNSPSPSPGSQSFLRRVTAVSLATLKVLGRRETWRRILGAVDFLLSNEIYTYASAIAFNALIAFFPAVIVTLTLVRTWTGASMHDAMLGAIIDYLPSNRAFFGVQITGVTSNFGGMTFLSLVILLFGAVGIFVPVELALNYVWRVAKPRHWMISQGLSFVLLIAFLFIALIPVGISHGIGVALETVFFFVPQAAVDWVEWVVLKIVTIPFTILAFAIVYLVLPVKKLTMEEILPAAILTGLGFEIGKYAYILLLPLLNFREVYGAFSVSVTFITWALFAAMMLLFGAWLTAQDLLPKLRWRRTAEPGATDGRPSSARQDVARAEGGATPLG